MTLFDKVGKLLFEMESADTMTALPDSIGLAPGRLYLWKVEARTGWERWVSSELIEFRVGPVSIQSPERDSLRLLARSLSDSALEPRGPAPAPRGARRAERDVGPVGPWPASRRRATELAIAHRLAAAYANAWHDEFLVREVARFTQWPAEHRAAKVWADSMRRVGITAFGRDGAAAAIGIWRRSLSRSAAIPDTAGMAATLGNIGAGFSRDDQPDSAETYLERCRTLALAVGDIRVQANAISELAGVSESRDDVAGARQYYAQAIALRNRIGDSRGLASDYNNLAGLAQDAGDFDGARQQLEAALAINRRDGRADVAATNLVNLAGLASLTGDFARAVSLYREALAHLA